jgi:pimeloyl-ACP methyl ester carboxylesterase
MPVLVIAGEADGRFRRLGAELVRAIGDNAELVVVAEAGHAVPFERPDRFADAVRRWFDALADRF